MTSSPSVRRTSIAPYGARELQLYAHRYLFIALGISIAIHLAVLCLYYLVAAYAPQLPAATSGGRIPMLIDYGSPSITWPAIPGGRVIVPQAPLAKHGTPVPVPEAEISPEASYPTQADLSSRGEPAGTEEVEGGGIPERPVEIPEEGPPPPFVPVEKMPVIIHSGIPSYPSVAARADLEGRVIVSVWVDKQGLPRQVVIANSTNEIFNDAALEAARQYRFIPAYMNAGPVSVWVSLAFNFRLK